MPKGEEIKWSPKKGSWLHQNLHGDGRTQCYTEILKSAEEAGCKAIVTAWDCGRTTLQGQQAFQKVLDYTLERIAMYLSKKDSLGVIVADRPGGSHKQDEAFLTEFLERVSAGTEYVKPDHVPINILTTPSHLQRHLQLADLVTAITCAMVAGQSAYAESYFPIIKRMLIANHQGYIGGTGLKVFPADLINLYHWVLGEAHFVTVSRNVGVPLPVKDRPYAEEMA